MGAEGDTSQPQRFRSTFVSTVAVTVAICPSHILVLDDLPSQLGLLYEALASDDSCSRH